MRHLVGAANAELVTNPANAISNDGDAELGLTRNEVNFVFGGAGFKPLPGSKVYGMTNEAFFVLYGHAIERLTAKLLIHELCLSKFVKHVPAAGQLKPGGSPDFIGVGKADKLGVAIDVTTELSAAKKTKSADKVNYQFLTYERGLKIDNNGHAVPVSPR